LVFVEVNFEDGEILPFDEDSWKSVIVDVTVSDLDNVEIVEVNVFQDLVLEGLSEATFSAEYEAALQAAYTSTFSTIEGTIISFESPAFTDFERRELSGYNFEISVTIETASEFTNVITAGLSTPDFVRNITQELEDADENSVIVRNSEVIGMEVVFSIKVDTIQTAEEVILNNEDLTSAFAAGAIDNNLLTASATINTNAVLGEVVTLSPTVSLPSTASPSSMPLQSPTRVPTTSTTRGPTIEPTLLSSASSLRPQMVFTLLSLLTFALR
jgi:hypothetical protein